MPSRVGSSVSGDAVRHPRRTGDRMGQSLMSEKQIQAYLASRDVVRRIKRTSEYFAPVHASVGLERPCGSSTSP